MENPNTWTKTQKIIHDALYNGECVNTYNVFMALQNNDLFTDEVDKSKVFKLIQKTISTDLVNQNKAYDEIVIGYSLSTQIYNVLKDNKMLK